MTDCDGRKINVGDAVAIARVHGSRAFLVTGTVTGFKLIKKWNEKGEAVVIEDETGNVHWTSLPHCVVLTVG